MAPSSLCRRVRRSSRAACGATSRRSGGRGDRSQRSAGTLERAGATIEGSLRDDGLTVTRLPYSSDGVTVAKACRGRGDDIVAMLSLETLGYFRDEAGSQKYPPIVSWFYPDRGDFIAFVGNLGSRGVVREAVATFRGAARFPSEGAALPSFVTGVGWSDQWSFWQVGYPGVMVTDTAPFRNPHYHQTSDTPDTLDYERLARVTDGLVAVVKKLAE
jgi:hypothetical protein